MFSPAVLDVSIGILLTHPLGPDCGICHPHETVSDVLYEPALRGGAIAIPSRSQTGEC